MSVPLAEPVQPAGALAQMLGELAAMLSELVALHKLHLDALRQRSERQARVLERVLSRSGGMPNFSAPSSSPISGVSLQKMTAEYDPQSFLDMFQATAEACGWPAAEWPVRLLPLLTGDAQTAALSLPAASQGRFTDIRKAVLDRLGFLPEDHRHRFRGTRLGTDDRPFVYVQQLRDAAARWLQPGETAGENWLLEKVVVEQFTEGLPTEIGNWVRCHCPVDLTMAVTLAEDHLAAHPGDQGRMLPVIPPTPRRKSAAQPTGAPRTPGAPIPAPRINFPYVSSSHQAPVAADAASNSRGAPQTSGQECWRCGQPGHTRRECPLREVDQVVRVAGPPAPSPGPGGTYSVPVRIQGGVHQAMVDSGCEQSQIHQNLVRPGALVEASWVRIRCVHGDVHKYPIVPVEIIFKGKKHVIKAAVSSRLAHSLILGTDWPGFQRAVGKCVGARSREVGTCGMCAVLSGDARSSDTADGEGEPGGSRQEAPGVPDLHPMEDFPLEQSRDDTVCSAFDQVIKIDGQLVHPGTALTYPHFALIRDRLYRVNHDAQMRDITTQLAVSKCCRETVFEAAHYNPMAGHMGYEKSLDRIMARFN
ncbi:uncharacterized protein LOC110961245 isoform X1 [Acanthochromis polyacanthus]|uniref:uncharacterized protein LOC110961245 isoform X1 n=1 Tax=Acanthochromis polyacanthus TaxID=80966 RepID=UPI00223453DA|nr:uncharacterized protein LOC110961245 isoform X1 [Acanthochromis polyacanthus]XP_051815567.1 uncharacterized protein LOC110961245 isoform X1 [Acanthochromis polyacanthus]XP_051815568.1 uncharacterized protein LOC110961245 isoform X1 [Acanthochromis polyacanthus]XP_051815569.1 uncharacterized protein LOC110961245 isoform X1 [Acanthochromis polyacanthus]XP_051815570.1 uncharacterized protein LOC110961245 isoform X1 [Acanthochromis polyacanthus]XP_051815571.1 uncharacterized protein LOC11096124